MCFQRRFFLNFSHFEYFIDPGIHLEMHRFKLAQMKTPVSLGSKVCIDCNGTRNHVSSRTTNGNVILFDNTMA
jgi:hypothetical protein